jgi:hypothetical protein
MPRSIISSIAAPSANRDSGSQGIESISYESGTAPENGGNVGKGEKTLPIPLDEENIGLVIGASTPHKLEPLASLMRFIFHRKVC